MARIRTIKPEFAHSESMGRISREARLLFMLLFTYVDDEGRGRGASQLLASLLYPYDKDVSDCIDDWLKELVAEDCILLYEADGSRYLQVANWLKHQKIDHPTKSKFPPPPEWFANSREDFAKPRESFAEPRASRARAGPKEKDLGPGEDLEKDQDHEKERTARSLSGEEASDANPRGWPPDYREQFEAAYPNRIGMAVALKALETARAGGKVTWPFMMEQLKAYAAKTDDRAWLAPKRWIEEERYNDRPGKPTGNGLAKPTAGDRARGLARQVEARERQGADRRPADAVGGAELGGDDARLVPGRKGPSG